MLRVKKKLIRLTNTDLVQTSQRESLSEYLSDDEMHASTQAAMILGAWTMDDRGSQTERGPAMEQTKWKLKNSEAKMSEQQTWILNHPVSRNCHSQAGEMTGVLQQH